MSPPTDLSSTARMQVGVMCWILGTYITFEALNSWARVFATWKAKRSALSKLVLFNLFSNMFSLLVTFIFVNVTFNKHTGYMFIEGLGHIMMVNSYLWLLYNRMMVLSWRKRSRAWFWVVVFQPIIPAVDVLIFSLQFAGVIEQGVFKITGSVFFLMVVSIEFIMNAATLIELITMYSSTSLNKKVKGFIMKCIIAMIAQLMLDIGLVITNYTVDGLIFIQLKRLVYMFKSRMISFMFDSAKTDLAVKRVHLITPLQTCRSEESSDGDSRWNIVRGSSIISSSSDSTGKAPKFSLTDGKAHSKTKLCQQDEGLPPRLHTISIEDDPPSKVVCIDSNDRNPDFAQSNTINFTV